MQKLARQLGDDAALRARAHEASVESIRKRGVVLGILEALLSTSVGATVVVAALRNEGAHSMIYVGLGFVLIAQPLIARLSTYLNNPVQADRHTQSSAAFYALNRTIALHLLDPEASTPDKLKRLVDKVNREFSEASANALPLTLACLRTARVRLGEERKLEAELRNPQTVRVARTDTWDRTRRWVGVALLPLIATTLVPYLIVSSSLTAHGKLAAIAVAFALALVLGSSWHFTATSAAQTPWSTLLAKISKPMTIGVVLILGSEMLLVLMGELQHLSASLRELHAFAQQWSGMLKAGLLALYAVIVSWLISKQENLWNLERGRAALAHSSEVTWKGHL
jgi:hypothetical protein